MVINIKSPKDVSYLFIISRYKLKEIAKNKETIKNLLKIIKLKKEHYNNFISLLNVLSYGQISAGC